VNYGKLFWKIKRRDVKTSKPLVIHVVESIPLKKMGQFVEKTLM
jgi:hypothetical protein